MSSFGANPTPAETQSHEIYKRSSTVRKVRKVKKFATTTTSTEAPIEVEITPKATIKKKIRKVLVSTTETPIETAAPQKLLVEKKTRKASSTTEKPFTVEVPQKPANFKDSPRHLVKFEPEDAKFSAEYEKLKQSRKLKPRVKRSTEDEDKSNTTRRVEKFITKDSFVQPRELFKFSYLDAVTTKAPETAETKENSEKKIKREVADSTAVESKKIQVSSPMRNQRSTKHVNYDEISQKLQKMIDAALHDAVQKGVASDGDYLKFYYGDTIIKVPVSMSKYVLNKSKEPSTSYVKKVVSYSSNKGEEIESKHESPKLLATKNTYYPLKNSKIKFDTLPHFLPTPVTEQVESYANFETPIVVQQEVEENNFSSDNKLADFYSGQDVFYGKNPSNSVSSPGPVLFHESTTPTTVEHSSTHYQNFIYHPPTKLSIVKDEIPIVEHVDEHADYSYVPLVHQKNHFPIHVPTSYVEYAGNHSPHEEKKSYEFGFVPRYSFRR